MIISQSASGSAFWFPNWIYPFFHFAYTLFEIVGYSLLGSGLYTNPVLPWAIFYMICFSFLTGAVVATAYEERKRIPFWVQGGLFSLLLNSISFGFVQPFFSSLFYLPALSHIPSWMDDLTFKILFRIVGIFVISGAMFSIGCFIAMIWRQLSKK